MKKKESYQGRPIINRKPAIIFQIVLTVLILDSIKSISQIEYPLDSVVEVKSTEIIDMHPLAHKAAGGDSLVIFITAKTMPEFPGGEKGLSNYLKNNIRYPDPSLVKWLDGTVYVRFVVYKDGSVMDVKLLRGIGHEYDQEALNVVRGMPKWKPGFQNGIPVSVLMTLPVKFGTGKQNQ